MGIQYHGTQTAGDKCTKLLCHRFASGLAVEHKGPVGGVGKQDAEDVVQHIAPAVGGGVAKQPVDCLLYTSHQGHHPCRAAG